MKKRDWIVVTVTLLVIGGLMYMAHNFQMFEFIKRLHGR